MEDIPAHAVQFYDGDVACLASQVGRYLGEGLRQGEGAVVIATPPHRLAFAAQLAADGLDPDRAIHEGWLTFRDADETLSRFMFRGLPDWSRFQAEIEALIEVVEARIGDARIRAYGEMVDLLWNAGQSRAAARLEEFWNRLLEAHGFSLYCAYQIDVFGKDFHASVLDSVLCSHTHLMPAGSHLEDSVDRALTDILGAGTDGMRNLMKDNFRPAWAAIPKGEAKVLWIRNNLPDYADEIMARARGYYEK